MLKIKYLYSLQHIHEIRKEDEEEINVKRLGVFFSKEQVKKAIKAYKQLPGFKEKKAVFSGDDDFTEGFCIGNMVIGISYWEGGFTPSDYSEEQQEVTINLPFWFKDTPEQVGESSTDFAERVMYERYNTTDYPRDPQSEFYQIKKFKELT